MEKAIISYKLPCVITGQKMKNCLVEWHSYRNRVVTIYKGDKIIAAVEFFNNRIEEARECENKAIDLDSDLCKAIVKWCKKNNIEFDPETLDNLPF